MRDLLNNIDVRSAIDPYDHATGDTAKTTSILDRQGFQGVVLSLHFGSIADSDVTFTVALAESDDSGMSGSNAVADVDLNGTEVLAAPTCDEDNHVFKLGYTGNKRYIQATITPANNTGDLLMEGTWILGFPDNVPTVNPPANA